jgi:hypothetical protein
MHQIKITVMTDTITIYTLKDIDFDEIKKENQRWSKPTGPMNHWIAFQLNEKVNCSAVLLI